MEVGEWAVFEDLFWNLRGVGPVDHWAILAVQWRSGTALPRSNLSLPSPALFLCLHAISCGGGDVHKLGTLPMFVAVLAPFRRVNTRVQTVLLAFFPIRAGPLPVNITNASMRLVISITDRWCFLQNLTFDTNLLEVREPE